MIKKINLKAAAFLDESVCKFLVRNFSILPPFHEIEWIYRPLSLFIGLVISIISFISFLLLVFSGASIKKWRTFLKRRRFSLE